MNPSLALCSVVKNVEHRAVSTSARLDVKSLLELYGGIRLNR